MKTGDFIYTKIVKMNSVAVNFMTQPELHFVQLTGLQYDGPGD
jgi:hypothetical protein